MSFEKIVESAFKAIDNQSLVCKTATLLLSVACHGMADKNASRQIPHRVSNVAPATTRKIPAERGSDKMKVLGTHFGQRACVRRRCV